jgi:hypothetical protein
MAGNRLLLATVVLAGLLAIVVWQFNAREAEDSRAPEVTVKLPKVNKDDVDGLSIAIPDKPALEFKKTDKTWNLVKPLSAAADKSAVDGVLGKLSELEVLNVAATKPDNHDGLEVTDKKGIHVVAKQGDKVLADLIIGAYRSGNTMVREQGAVNVAAVKGSLRFVFEKDIKDWREKLIVEETADQSVSLAFDNEHGSFHFVKDGTTWKQAPGDKPIANFESGKLLSLNGTATSLRAQDFAGPEITPEAAGLAPKPVATATLKTGGDAGEKTIVLHVGKKIGENYYLAREGRDTIYIVSDFAGSRMSAGPDKFVKDEPKPTASAAPAQKPGQPGQFAHPNIGPGATPH